VTLATPEQVSFTAQGVPLLRAQQLLAELHYLPLRFGPSSTQSALAGEPTVPSAVSTAPQPGSFTWRFADVPPTLASQWAPGQQTVVTQGAIMQFEYVNGLTVDGIAGPQVWAALTRAVAGRKLDPYPYDYLMVSESLPESLTVWREGKDIYQTPVNTGVPGANTPVGTWPVYEHVQYSDMQGTDVNGYHYNVPNVPWVAYFYDGDAVHGYWRASYGYPQSNGCVELPIANAATVWPMDPIGTLVNVSA
jgi:peptidoglycan hydrolase-like protein with peptidoglycan-binding domain